MDNALSGPADRKHEDQVAVDCQLVVIAFGGSFPFVALAQGQTLAA